VSVRENEWLEVGAWVYEHFDEVSGLSFLPLTDHIYRQAPFQDCTEEEYKAFELKMPETVDWAHLVTYENTDQTIGAQTLACSSATGCEV
jgi:ribonucleoside-diphosphate reductase alpha chain